MSEFGTSNEAGASYRRSLLSPQIDKRYHFFSLVSNQATRIVELSNIQTHISRLFRPE